jgi:hypothetical protein
MSIAFIKINIYLVTAVLIILSWIIIIKLCKKNKQLATTLSIIAALLLTFLSTYITSIV